LFRKSVLTKNKCVTCAVRYGIVGLYKIFPVDVTLHSIFSAWKMQLSHFLCKRFFLQCHKIGYFNVNVNEANKPASMFKNKWSFPAKGMFSQLRSAMCLNALAEVIVFHGFSNWKTIFPQDFYDCFYFFSRSSKYNYLGQNFHSQSSSHHHSLITKVNPNKTRNTIEAIQRGLKSCIQSVRDELDLCSGEIQNQQVSHLYVE